MRLNVRDVTRLLDVSEQTLLRWIKQDNLPAHPDGERYRFSWPELVEWVASRRIPVPKSFYLYGSEQDHPRLGAALQRGGVLHDVAGHDKASVLLALVRAMSLPESVKRDEFFDLLLAREALGSTGIGDGIALPHARNALVLEVPEPSVTLAYTARPVEFGAIDAEPVRALFCVVSPTTRAHLHLLSRIAYCLHDERVRASVRRQRSAEEVLASIDAVERELDARRREQAPSVP
jgi:PTS system nitrogen regulatory IIA component